MLKLIFSQSRAEWHVLFATWLGTFFDGMDASIFVLALFPTLSELLHTTSHSEVGVAASYILAAFMVGWTVGAVLFGRLADRIGRVRVMIMTILLYAIATGLCATSQNTVQLSFYRFLVGCGIGGEVSIGGVLLAESWRGNARYWATGLMLTSFGAGYLGMALLNMALGSLGWRVLYLVGMVPAVLTIYIRLKLKESVQFADAHAHRSSSEYMEKNSVVDAIATLLSPAYSHRLGIVVLLASTTIVGYWAILAWIPAWINQLTGTAATVERSVVAVSLNIGTIVGSIALGFAFSKLGRKRAFAVCFIGALISCIDMFATIKAYGTALLCWVFFVGLFVQSPFVALFIYVPELFPVRLRATAFGIGVQSGRLMAALAAVMAGQLISVFGGSYALAGSCVSLMYIVGLCACRFMPATNGEVFPEEVVPEEVVPEEIAPLGSFAGSAGSLPASSASTW